MNNNNISLQINVSPADLNYFEKLIERQIVFWYEELNEIVISIESKKSFGKFAKDFDENKQGLISLVEDYIQRYPKIRYHFIDYSANRKYFISNLFFNRSWIPDKDYRGCAFYSYLDGLAECRNKYVIHLDSDMLLGGKPNSWLNDAVELLSSKIEYLIVNPLAGPPASDFDIKQKYLKEIGTYTFLFNKLSSRIFLIDMEKLSLHKLTLRKIPFTAKNLKWLIKNKFHWGYNGLEDIISEMMQINKLFRVDTLGKNETDICFSLHPLIKPNHFIEAIPELLKRIDKDDFPETQRGNYNVCDEFFDFKKNRHA